MRVIQAMRRANSHWRYWMYRRQIGNPVSALETFRQWWARLRFELSNIRQKG